MGISEKKMQIVIDNYFKTECDVNTSIRSAFEKGFMIGVKKGQSVQPGIIRCRDCIAYKEGLDIDGKPFTRCNGINGSVRTYGHTLPDWYCADAERRTDEQA